MAADALIAPFPLLAPFSPAGEIPFPFLLPSPLRGRSHSPFLLPSPLRGRRAGDEGAERDQLSCDEMR